MPDGMFQRGYLVSYVDWRNVMRMMRMMGSAKQDAYLGRQAKMKGCVSGERNGRKVWRMGGRVVGGSVEKEWMG